ncbi:hypothetical protein HMPREF9488_00712 [Coprobacillus cateniformis]|jgi:DNA-binding transcriptional MerR regulator|uniref:HTH merR-type domain-containing protein n=1 Tax=Coprobacillus cateniformis TaxID=100884 RepID=E7G7A7_9FIRM|nr:MerR family transcriptional regulator [Coprobacillus cateniformis]EFW06073.1 hypothetical protein HMPREF9488_00712 [Coprobacillus cateniformis]RGY47362.1 MerR family transcriptional regulator [Coprobacillus cateniformis]
MYIQEISQKLQLSKKAINLYEEKGLIHPQRDDNGYRIYLEKEKQTLLKIKELRRLGFCLEEIKKILLEKQYHIFEQKKTEYQEKIFQINTSIQYIDDVKETLMNENDISEVSQEIDQIYHLEVFFNQDHTEIDFDKLCIYLFTLAWVFASKIEINFLCEFLSYTFYISAFLIYSSSQVRLFLFKIVRFFEK